jgi:S-methylmethionine-dependent homocysteine/selenocysteine methylase
LPQLGGELFLTDGGIETSLIFHDGLDLPLFAAFDLLRRDGGRDDLWRYYAPYLEIARHYQVGFVLESPTWRASPDWGTELGYDGAQLAAANRDAIGLMVALRAWYLDMRAPVVISGCVGPRGDGYHPASIMTVEQARSYHREQIETLATTAADLITAITMTNVPEAVGIVLAARDAGMPVAVSFTVETDGRLPAGQTLGEAIAAVDDATAGEAAYYMINCAHPRHFIDALRGNDPCLYRIRGIRANASAKSHAELNESATLDAGDPDALALDYAELRRLLPRLNVLGGCCGTDHRHVAAIGAACVHTPPCEPVVAQPSRQPPQARPKSEAVTPGVGETAAYAAVLAVALGGTVYALQRAAMGLLATIAM